MQFEEAKNFIVNKLALELPAHLTYHSIYHTHDVLAAAEFIADEEGVTGEDKLLLLTASAYHDSGFLYKAKGHEEKSCVIAGELLPRYGYSDEQIKIIDGMIMATRLPQQPHNLLEEIICDSDLDYLGRDDFFEIGETLFREFHYQGIVTDEAHWNQVQLKFLEEHHYFTETSLRLRAGKKAENVAILKAKIDKAEANEKV